MFELYGLLSDRGSVTVVASNYSRVGECRNDENQFEIRNGFALAEFSRIQETMIESVVSIL